MCFSLDYNYFQHDNPSLDKILIWRRKQYSTFNIRKDSGFHHLKILLRPSFLLYIFFIKAGRASLVYIKNILLNRNWNWLPIQPTMRHFKQKNQSFVTKNLVIKLFNNILCLTHIVLNVVCNFNRFKQSCHSPNSI